ncbi:MAG: TetR/AcrR family transcriptional regulator [Nakamurella sp.]
MPEASNGPPTIEKPTTNQGPRARYRRQVRDEVRERAWAQIGQDGASALSLKAIATAMGMTAPALYRYYNSRDELLTELILSAYLDLAERVEAAVDGDQPPERQLADIAQVIRGWAVAEPQRYLLLYGTPVPGYHAPEAATELARRILAPVLAAFANSGPEPEDRAFHQSITFWTRLHGVLSLEAAGHFTGMQVDVAELFGNEVRSLLGTVG